ncbi:hypothetical protein [Tsuneonella dongtanensis]|nr:hypothetical protein [Tsuneonella dongtanensis]
MNTLAALNQRLDQVPPHEVDQIERQIAAIHDDLLDTPAPHLAAVAAKLNMLWEAKMHGLDKESEERRLILEDLEGLVLAQRELLGA